MSINMRTYPLKMPYNHIGDFDRSAHKLLILLYFHSFFSVSIPYSKENI